MTGGVLKGLHRSVYLRQILSFSGAASMASTENGTEYSESSDKEDMNSTQLVLLDVGFG